jgi:bifunctional DNA-binding transcriptional regulator/antitoxin component of YhaV-PrlF toxin-antitoxin module
MPTVTITAKRQATFPAALCEELGLAPGAKVTLERRVVAGETVWLLRGRKPDWSWVGLLRRYAGGKSHRLTDIRRSIDRGWARGPRP